MKTLPAFGTSVSRPLGSLAARLAQTVSAFISGTTPAMNERSGHPVALKLARGEVYRLDQRGDTHEIQVLDGTLWLTTTPAKGDIVLRGGERFSAPDSGLVVFEALEDASVLLIGNA